MEKLRKNKGITLVALVITIVILLILAGISIQVITNIGLFEKAKMAKEETRKEQLKEDIILAIQDIQIEEISKGDEVTLKTLAGGQLESKLKDITAELIDGKINGEYKDYEYTIDSKFNVTINGTLTKINGKVEVRTGYVFEGSTVEIKVTASITEGTITEIEAPEGATLKTDISTTEKIYTVNKNGDYTFKITSNSGKTKNITTKVENILSTPQIKVDEIKRDSFKISLENDYPEGIITEYKYYVDGIVKQQNTKEKSYIVSGLTQKTKYSDIKVVAYINSISKESNLLEVTTKDDSIEYSWEEIAEIAKEISNNTSITDDSESATIIVNGEQKTLNVGDKAILDGKKVRILGFNHDELSEPDTAYGITTVTGKAGISFEYVDILTTSRINSGDTNAGGWEKTEIRKNLNETTYNLLSIKKYIKKVKKEYISTYNVVPKVMPTADDYLWLLSCGEIWNNGYNGGITRGNAITTEGKQYKYYKINLKSTSWEKENNVIKKPNANDSTWWWLRSPFYNDKIRFCRVTVAGYCTECSTSKENGIAPGFSI